MVVTAMLNWFDEPPELLRQAVRGAAVIADRLVAADGAYELVDDKRATSPREQREAIKDEAEKCGLKVEFMRPRIWAGQVAKRTATLQRACKGSDWVLVVDADWRITGDREAIRAELEYLLEMGYDEIVVRFLQPRNPDRPLEDAPNIWHIQETGHLRTMSFIYRAMWDMRYERNHWSLSGVRADGMRVAFFGGRGTHPEDAKTGFLHSDHLFEHLCLFREEKQVRRNRDYIGRRDAEVARVGYET